MLCLDPTISIIVIGTLLLSHFTPVVLALRTTEGSPCTDICHKASTNTTSSEIVCLDNQYNTTTTGTDFQKCVECQLRSTYADSSSGESDVLWGLYNLRYAFTSCVYGYPQQVANISSPCVVSCQPLSPALEFDLTTPSALNFDAMCGVSSFSDKIVSKCEFCYNLTLNQVYLANFIEAVRYDCHFPTSTGAAFAIDPARIFKQLALPASTLKPTKSSSTTQKNLAIIIALPILGAVLLICITAICCFFFIRRRRKLKAKKRRQSAYIQAYRDEPAVSTTPSPPRSWGDNGPAQDPASVVSGGYGPSFGLRDTNDGYQRQDAGYSESRSAREFPGGSENVAVSVPPASYFAPPPHQAEKSGYYHQYQYQVDHDESSSYIPASPPQK